jgi:nodulation protein E
MAMQSMQVLTLEACRPFSANRTGTVLAEAAGILILESEDHARARGASILAELRGAAQTASAHDMVAPVPEAAAEAMTQALADARLPPDSIDYLNAFGVGTRKSDRSESQAIKMAFPDHYPRIGISSTKSMHGYAMGATGAIEAAVCVKAIQEGYIPPTIGLDRPDPQCDLDFTPNVGRVRHVDYAMSISMALGGLNTALIFGPPPA